MWRTICFFTVWFGFSSLAWGFQLHSLNSGKYVRWHKSNIEYRVHHKGSQDLPFDSTLEALQRSFATWQGAMKGKATFSYKGLSKSPEAGYEQNAPEGNENLLIWREKEWPHSPKAIAMTLVTYNSETGEILDADIEFNGVSYRWINKNASASNSSRSLVDGRRNLPPIDVENTATHEIGHFLGLGHSANHDATMYGEQGSEEIRKRTLHIDDQNAIDTLYKDLIQETIQRRPYRLPQPPVGWGCSSQNTTPSDLGFYLLPLLILPFMALFRR